MQTNGDSFKLSSIVGGAVAGLIATVPMSIVMLGLHRLLPMYERYPVEPYRITTRMARRVGLTRRMTHTEREVAATVAHFSYGAAAGAVFVPWAVRLPVPLALTGIVFGLFVWTASYMGLLPAIGILSPAQKHPARRNALMIAAHVVWGAALGWLVQLGQDMESEGGSEAFGS